jgi:hypothetical protein
LKQLNNDAQEERNPKQSVEFNEPANHRKRFKRANSRAVEKRKQQLPKPNQIIFTLDLDLEGKHYISNKF